MIKNFNWGHGIALFYVCFVGLVIWALIISFSVDRSLVVDDYYATDIAYQSQYDKAENSMQSPMLYISQNTKTQIITIGFNSEKSVLGTAHWYRPSDQSADFIVDLIDKETKISTEKILKGKWILKVEWTIDGMVSYAEEQIIIE